MLIIQNMGDIAYAVVPAKAGTQALVRLAFGHTPLCIKPWAELFFLKKRVYILRRGFLGDTLLLSI